MEGTMIIGISVKFIYSQTALNMKFFHRAFQKHRYLVQFTSVTQSCPNLCNPMDYSILSFPVLRCLLEFAQTHVHLFGEAIQPSHPLSAPPPVLNLSQHQVFSNESFLWIRWPKYWSFNFSISPSSEHSGLISFRTDWWAKWWVC